jgi:putative tryptophan/tyrosine transport system substrate-binding protein
VVTRSVWLRLTVLVLVLGIIQAAPTLSPAQTSTRVYRVGVLAMGSRTPDGRPPAALREGLQELGYVEGKNIVYEARWAEGRAERLPALAAELVSAHVDVLVTQGGPPTSAAKAATATIPIVMSQASGDAVAMRWIESLARPGGNVTGLTDESVQLSAKRMELLKEAIPKASVIAVLWNANDQGMTLRYHKIEEAARVLGVKVQPIEVRTPEDFEAAFVTMTRRRPDAMFLVADGLTTMNGKRVVEFANAQRIPAMYEWNFLVRDGGLLSYGVVPADGFRRAAVYVDRIFKGAKPSELPAEQPTRYVLSVNMRTAAALGVTLPPSLRLRADDVVE